MSDVNINNAMTTMYKLGLEEGKKIGRLEAMREVHEMILALEKSQDRMSALIDEIAQMKGETP